MIYVNSVSVYPGSIHLETGQWYYGAYAQVCPTNATCRCVTWSSSNSGIVSVNYLTGYIYANRAGTATIYATAQDGSGRRGACTVTVSQTVPVSSITLSNSSLTLQKNTRYALSASVYPGNATNKCLTWSSSNPSVAPISGSVVCGRASGTATITCAATDGSGVKATCRVTVTGNTLVNAVTVCPSTMTLTPGRSDFLYATVCPGNASNRCITWSSSNPSVATVNPTSGYVRAQGPGIATIYATAQDGSRVRGTCEVWVRGKTPVFMLHGRVSHSSATWGALNSILFNPTNTDHHNNDHYDPNVNAVSMDSTPAVYINKGVQDIKSYKLKVPITVDGVENDSFILSGIYNGELKDGKYSTEHPEGGNLAWYLKEQGYKANVNLFVFNYPNQDAVVHSAEKLKAYIDNLISYVRTSGSAEMKACFYASRADYTANNYQINLIGHSMGGLVSRYYIENLRQDHHVDKLITIDTPHWGSGYANVSCSTGIEHKLCDHDLHTNSAMNGGSYSTASECNLVFGNCNKDPYTLTDALQYQRPRRTRYYAIAGIDFSTNGDSPNQNDYAFNMPTCFTTYQQIEDFFREKNIYRYNDALLKEEILVKTAGDNMVGFASQIGWTENDGASPRKRIQMEKIFVDVDTNGGNTITAAYPKNLFHTKIQHRERVMEKVYCYLQE